ncbi:hypothetical protein ACOTTU_21970 [Roseobacter sp. EG26]|uniref:hypothetical protein n=1 Tax=Roseobacter sp. EG26 TaxID=3412477 RepID=UPI003CE4EC05
MTYSGRHAVLTVSAALSALLSFGASNAAAQDLAEVPEGCQPVATVHKNGCATTTISQCSDATWQAVSYRRGKPLGTLSYDRDWGFFKWQTHESNKLTLELVPGTGTAMSRAALLETGRHDASGEFRLTTNIIEGQPYILTGNTEKTGATEVISGETYTFYKARRLFEREVGKGGLSFEVDVLIAEDRDLMIEGRWSRSVMGGNEEVFEFAPRAIARPGDSGFLATLSEYGCE